MEVKTFIPWGEGPIDIMSEEYADSISYLQKVGDAIIDNVIYHNNDYLILDEQGYIDIEKSKKEIKDIFIQGMYIPEDVVDEMNLDIHTKEFSDDIIDSVDWYEILKKHVKGDLFMVILDEINWEPVLQWSKIYQVIDINSEDCNSLFWEQSGNCLTYDPSDIDPTFMY